jgi:hypothetical protein
MFYETRTTIIIRVNRILKWMHLITSDITNNTVYSTLSHFRAMGIEE